ncbi:MAG: helix-turn-helix domain-containing protein [Acidobacteriota bacterium]
MSAPDPSFAGATRRASPLIEVPDAPIPLHDFEPARPDAVPIEIGPIGHFGATAISPRPHRHTFYEICLVTAGRARHAIDFTEHPARAGSLFTIVPGQVHAWHDTQELAGQILLFTEDFLHAGPSATAPAGEWAFLHGLAAAGPLRLDPADAEAIGRAFDALAQEFRRDLPARASMLRAQLQTLLIRLLRLADATPRGTAAADPATALAQRFRTLVLAHGDTERALPFYARALNVSVAHLHDQVRRTTGRTPGQLLRSHTALEARRLLAHSALRVSEIGHRLAFDDPSYFSRFFRRETGLSPGQFRARIREKYPH